MEYKHDMKKHELESRRELKCLMKSERDPRTEENSTMSRQLYERDTKLATICRGYDKLKEQLDAAEKAHGLKKKRTTGENSQTRNLADF